MTGGQTVSEGRGLERLPCQGRSRSRSVVISMQSLPGTHHMRTRGMINHVGSSGVSGLSPLDLRADEDGDDGQDVGRHQRDVEVRRVGRAQRDVPAHRGAAHEDKYTEVHFSERSWWWLDQGGRGTLAGRACQGAIA